MNSYFWLGFIPSYLRVILLMTITGSVITLLLLLFQRLLGDRISQSAGYRLWKAALAGFLVPISLFLSLPLSTPVTPLQNAIERTTAELGWQQDAAEAGAAPVPAAPGGREEAAEERLPMGILLAAVPAAGAAGLFLWTSAGYFLFARRLRRSRKELDSRDLKLMETYRTLVPKKPRPDICRSDLVPTPMLVGLRHPVIYLPDREYTEEQLENILRHELTHWRRGDVALKWWGMLLVCLHWFNPLAWLARRELNRCCELACDEAVIADLDDGRKQQYGNTLIEMVAQARVPGLVLTAAVCEEKRTLKERLTAIMNSHPISWKELTLAAAATAVALTLGLLLGAHSAGYVDPNSVLSASKLSLDTENSAPISAALPLYDAYPYLQEDAPLPDAYTQALVQTINAYGKTPLTPRDAKLHRLLAAEQHWIRLDTADGGYWVLHRSYCNTISLNPLRPGEVDYEFLLTRVDAGGTPLQTWRLDYLFDDAFQDLNEDGTRDSQWTAALALSR